ncbi:MAG TPA: cation diffusion facilitator family transporter [Gammaproteobacteria bacterium]|nr:cation diffusion facilitator family transporter [Gammaproteobacteria bacterium]
MTVDSERSIQPTGIQPDQARLMHLAGYASLGVALTLTALKSWAWIATGSVAMLSSLADSLLDLLASAITLFAVTVAVSPADREHRFGHGKSEGIAGIFQAVIISGSALYVCVQAVERLLAPAPVTSPAVGTFVIVVSLLLTLSLAVLQHYVIRRTGSLAISADAAHYRSDILTNVAVLAAIQLSSRWGLHIFDPLLALVVVGLILWSVQTILRDALKVLLDHELPDDDRRRIATIARAHPEVRGLHDMRTRSSGAAQFIQFHLELDPKLNLTRAHEICAAVEAEVQQAFPTAEVLIHADPYGLPENRDPF